MADAGGDGWSGGATAAEVTTDGASRYNATLTAGSTGVQYMCLEDGIHHLIIRATDPEITWEFDDTSGNHFNGGAPIDDVFHTAAGELYGAPSLAPTASTVPSPAPSP